MALLMQAHANAHAHAHELAYEFIVTVYFSQFATADFYVSRKEGTLQKQNMWRQSFNDGHEMISMK